MEQAQAQQVSFFHLSSRIGRLRYFTYGIILTWVELPLTAVSVLAILQHNLLRALVLTLITYTVFLPIRCTFAIRRLHDMDWSGWWCLLVLPQALLNLIKVVNPAAIGPGLNFLSLLVLAILGLIVLFTRGTPGDNRYGPMPPANTGWVVLGAWSGLLMLVLIIVAVTSWVFSYRTRMADIQISDSIRVATSMEEPAAEYYRQKKVWPPDPSQLFGPRDPNEPPGRYMAGITAASAPPDGQSFGMVAMMKNAGLDSDIAGHSFEVWTTDGGETWHCGPGGEAPIQASHLPESCRDEGALPP